MPNYYMYIHGGVGTHAGNMEDIGTMVEMESLYLQYVAYNYYLASMQICGSGLGARLPSSYIYRYINNACVIPRVKKMDLVMY